jgi:uncharacterized protein YxjI
MDAPRTGSDDGVDADAVPSSSGSVRYRVPQNIAALEGPVTIRSDLGAPTFLIDGDAGTRTETVRIQDMEGRIHCQVDARAVRTGDPVRITGPRVELLATIRRSELSLVRDQFVVQVEPGAFWTIDGQVAVYAYRILAQDGPIAEVARRWFRARATYGVEVIAGVPHAVVLAVAICLDLIISTRR